MLVFELCHDVFSCLGFRKSGLLPAERVAGILHCLSVIFNETMRSRVAR
jgi:hypothetical protein